MDWCYRCLPGKAEAARRKPCLVRGAHRPTGPKVEHEESTTQRCADCGTLVDPRGV